jgi:uncharacterized membrane protein AbrB (regulator of aidB expression)
MLWIKQHKLLFVIIIVVLAALFWYGLSASTPAAPILSTDTVSGSPSAESSDQELVATLLALRAVTLSGTIFQDPAFTALADFSTAIVPEPVGRDNPFAPIATTTPKGTTDNPHAAKLFGR